MATTPRPDRVARAWPAFVEWLTVHAIGQVRAVPAREIVLALNLGSDGRRLLRALKHAAIEAGVLVCSSNDGYYVPTSRAEIDECVGRLRSESYEMRTLADDLERLADRRFAVPPLPVQPSLLESDPTCALDTLQ